jgi:hypothetical protein
LCDAWLTTSHECINGVQQKGKVYWRKVVQEYSKIKLHKPYEMRMIAQKNPSEKDEPTSNTRPPSFAPPSTLLLTTPRERHEHDGTGK